MIRKSYSTARPGSPTYEDTSRYDRSLKLVLGGILLLTSVVGIILLFEDRVGALVMFGITIFDALLFKVILPQRFQIFEDRVRIVLGGPFAITLRFSNIREVKRAPAIKASAYWGIRLATSSKYVLEIVRKKGLSLVISPTTGDVFLEQLNQARKKHEISAFPSA